MSCPRSKAISANWSFVTKAYLRYGSPKQSQHLTVNIQNGEKPTDVKYGNSHDTQALSEENPYKDLKLPESHEEFKTILMQKDRTIEAMNIMVKIIREEPLFENGVIIPEYSCLRELIKLLTNAEDVEFTEKSEESVCCDCSCTSGSSESVYSIEKIFVKINGVIHNLKYTFPEVIMKLEEFKISYKVARIASFEWINRFWIYF